MKSTWNHHPGETFDMLIHASSFFIERLPGPSFILATPWHSQCSMSFTCHRIFKKVSCFSFWFRSILTPPVSTVSSREVFEWFHQTPNSWKWEEFCTNPLLSFVSFDKATVAANYLQLTWNGFLVGNDCIFSKNYCLQPLVSFLPTVLTCFAYSEMVAEPFVGNKTLHTKSKTWAFNHAACHKFNASCLFLSGVISTVNPFPKLLHQTLQIIRDIPDIRHLFGDFLAIQSGPSSESCPSQHLSYLLHCKRGSILCCHGFLPLF